MALLKHWTPFPGRPNRPIRGTDPIRVSINPRGVIYFSEHAWIALRMPAAVELCFDKGLRLIGIKKCHDLQPNAFPVKPRGLCRGKEISAAAFLTHFALRMARTGRFNQIDIDDEGMMTLHLDSLTAISRGSR